MSPRMNSRIQPFISQSGRRTVEQSSYNIALIDSLPTLPSKQTGMGLMGHASSSVKFAASSARKRRSTVGAAPWRGAGWSLSKPCPAVPQIGATAKLECRGCSASAGVWVSPLLLVRHVAEQRNSDAERRGGAPFESWACLSLTRIIAVMCAGIRHAPAIGPGVHLQAKGPSSAGGNAHRDKVIPELR